MSCCETYIDLGCLDSCDTIETGYTTDETGTHVVVFDWLNTRREVEVEFEISDSVDIAATIFNESSEVIFKVQKPGGTYITDGNTECFKVDLTYKAG